MPMIVTIPQIHTGNIALFSDSFSTEAVASV